MTAIIPIADRIVSHQLCESVRRHGGTCDECDRDLVDHNDAEIEACAVRIAGRRDDALRRQAIPVIAHTEVTREAREVPAFHAPRTERDPLVPTKADRLRDAMSAVYDILDAKGVVAMLDEEQADAISREVVQALNLRGLL